MAARADFVQATGTSGAGTFTLTTVANYANFNGVFGAAGTPRLVSYAAFDGAGNFEEGVGLFTPGAGNTATLTRVPTSTFTAGAFTNTGAITAVNFPSAPTVELGIRSRDLISPPPAVQSSVGDGLGTCSTAHLWLSSSAPAFSGGLMVAVPVRLEHAKSITKASIFLDTAAGSAASLRVGIYDWGAMGGLPANLVSELTLGSQFNLNATAGAAQTLTSAGGAFTEFVISPGSYWEIWLSNGGGAVHSMDLAANSLAGTSGNRAIRYLTRTQAYGALPASLAGVGGWGPNNTSGGVSCPGLLLS